MRVCRVELENFRDVAPAQIRREKQRVAAAVGDALLKIVLETAAARLVKAQAVDQHCSGVFKKNVF